VPTDTWTGQSSITIWWAGASVGGPCPGTPSYSVAWSQSQTTIPDTVVDTAGNSANATNLSDGLWWFHLRTRDAWSNWSADVIRIGPFRADRTPPTLPFATATTPAVNTWSSSDRITVSLSAALDAGSGLSGYAVVWDQSPTTLPGASQNTGGVSSISAGPLSGAGSWYAHVRSVDQVGNWSPDAAHFGPFRIDRVVPNLPTVLGAAPPINVWTAAAGLQVDLAAGADVGSGLRGYSVVWDTAPATVPDDTLEVGVTPSLTANMLATAADWYLHVRSLDHAGNVSSGTLHYGPFRVDRAPPGLLAVSSAAPPSMTWSNAATLVVNLMPASDAGSGLDGYSIVWDASPSTQPDADKDIGAVNSVGLNTPSNAVSTWYLHARSLDQVGNVSPGTMHHGPFWIDRVPPASVIFAPPVELAGAPIPVSWSGSDAGSGVAAYSAQARLSPSGAWSVWVSDAPSSTLNALYTPGAPQCGQRYEFRSRARDAAGNLQAGWSMTASTLLISSHPITGLVVNNLGQPVYGVQFTASDACTALPSDAQGRAWAYFTAPGAYTLTVAHPRFGSLPALRERSVGGPRPRVVLPPQDNVLLNSHFKTNAGWTFFGQAGYAGIAHSG